MVTSTTSCYASHGLARDGFRLVTPPFPSYLRKALDTLYGNTFCSPIRFLDETSDSAISAIVFQNEESIRQVFLIAKTGPKITVLNELFTLPAFDLEQFVRHVFERWDDVSCVIFGAICVDNLSLPYPYQRFNKTEDIAASLPPDVAAYQSMLSKNTWGALRRYQKKLEKDHPDMKFETYERDQATSPLIDQIITLSKARITKKRQVPTHSDASISELKRLVAEYGVTLVARIGDKLCGGVICTKIQDQVYMHVIAHDLIYDNLRLGKICCFLSICDAIKRGNATYHMLSGEFDYKYQFLGKRREYDRIAIYRSYNGLIENIFEYVNNEVRGRGRRVKQVFKIWRKKWNR
jgi:hypothetical protein